LDHCDKCLSSFELVEVLECLIILLKQDLASQFLHLVVNPLVIRILHYVLSVLINFIKRNDVLLQQVLEALLESTVAHHVEWLEFLLYLFVQVLVVVAGSRLSSR
jgi:hypothetical protein